MSKEKSDIMEFTTIGQAIKLTGLSYLGNINSSAKIKKNQKVSNNYTYIMYLLPHKASGYNVCPMATNECIKGCLNTSGRVKMDVANRILNSRLVKTKLFFEQREFFMNWLFAEIKQAQNKAIKNGFDFSVRLNGTSDIDWSIHKVNGLNVFNTFKEIQFYDYTKVPNRFNRIGTNQHLTFSYTGYNWNVSKTILNMGYNVAVVFNTNDLPNKFKGYKVINGDLTDFRPNDGVGMIIGLKWKHIANKVLNEQIRNSIFVVQPNNKNCGYIYKIHKNKLGLGK